MTATEPRLNPGPTNEAGFDRLRDFVLQATEDGREPRADWREILRDVALDLDKLAYGMFAHPDSVLLAGSAMSSLASIWLGDEEKEHLYLEGSDV